MRCQICNDKVANVHVTEIQETGSPATPDEHVREIEEKHVCSTCAQSIDLPHVAVQTKNVLNIWNLLQQTAAKAKLDAGLACPQCGMTLAEFRSKGRLGCPNDYTVFREHLEPLLLRVHNATRHVGRSPGVEPAELDRRERLSSLRSQLENAIRDEAYEDAAALRDQIQSMEEGPTS